MKRAERRVIIVFDGAAWYVRRLASIEHDLTHDEKVYRADKPLGKRFTSLEDAAARAHQYLRSAR